MTIAYQIIDAFTSKAYAGNPAAVLCLPSRASGVAPPSDAWHLSLAREFNLAETAFLTELEDSTPTAPHYLIRWFTTVREFELCGHATLSSSSFLFTKFHPEAEGIAFETTMAGPLSAKRVAGGDKIELDFPADHQLLEFAPEGWVAADVVAAAEAANPAFVGKVLGWGRGKVLGWVIEIAADVKLEGISLDTKAFIPLGGYVVFTQAGTDPAGPHIKSRVIVPEENNLEDPVVRPLLCLLCFEHASSCKWLATSEAYSLGAAPPSHWTHS